MYPSKESAPLKDKPMLREIKIQVNVLSKDLRVNWCNQPNSTNHKTMDKLQLSKNNK